jgi:NADPH:quinone reductase-like Zn-dependent oxidoreductase
MKAMTYHTYGGPEVVALAEVPKPEPKSNEVLIRVLATTVSSGDWRARSLSMPPGFALLGRLVFGISGPRQPILGTELAGIVEQVGPGVSRFKVGDEVMAFLGGRFGCHAEYRAVPEDGLIAHKPASLSFEEAASLGFGSATALPLLRDKAMVRAGDRVLVVGGSGAVGIAAVQIAKHFGATVTAVTSTPNVRQVASFGADAVIDYKRVDFAKIGAIWDIILDTTGTVPFSRCAEALSPGGRLVAVQASFGQVLGLGKPPRTSGKQLIVSAAPMTAEDYRFIANLAASGELKPMIDRTFPLEEAAKAHAYVDTGRKRGSVVLTVGPDLAATGAF